jgi:hypothetical protein
VHLRAAALQECPKTGQSTEDFALGHHIGVEGEIDRSVVERDLLPVGQCGLAAEPVGAPPVPDTEERDAAQSHGDGGISLEDPLGDPERDQRVSKLLSDGGVDIEEHLGAARELVFDGLASLINARLVGTELEVADLAEDTPDRDEEGRHPALGVGEAEAFEVGFGFDGAVATSTGNACGDRGIQKALAMLFGQVSKLWVSLGGHWPHRVSTCWPGQCARDPPSGSASADGDRDTGGASRICQSRSQAARRASRGSSLDTIVPSLEPAG